MQINKINKKQSLNGVQTTKKKSQIQQTQT